MKRRFIIAAIVTIILAALQYTFQLYRFYGISADHQFMLDGDWIIAHLKVPGGLALLMASTISQLFIWPAVGVVFSTLLYLCISWMIVATIKKRGGNCILHSLSLLPIAFLILSMENSNYGYRGHVALTIATLCIYAYELAYTTKTTSIIRSILAAICVGFLYWAIGSAALVTATFILFSEISQRRIPVGGLTGVIFVVVLAYSAVGTSAFTSMKEALTPLQYYNWPSTYFFQMYAWATIVLTFIVNSIIKKIKISDKASKFISGGLLVCIIGCSANMFRMVHNAKTYRLIQESYFADNGDWDSIIRLHEKDRQPVFFFSYLNLALAEKGVLIEKMNRYNQMDVSEKLGWQPSSTEGLTIMSNVCYHIGYLSAARKAAFELNVLTPGSFHPRELVKLASVCSAMGEENLAEKYMYIAHKSPIYSNSTMSTLGNRKPEADRFMEIDGLKEDLSDIVNTNPENKIAKQFLEAYIIIWNKYRSK